MLRSKHDAPSPLDELEALRRDVESLTSARDADARRQAAIIRERVDRIKADMAASERKHAGGPCIYCGASKSYAWNGNPGRQWCWQCQEDKGFHLSDDEHKSMILRRILSGDWTQRRYAVGNNARTEVQRAGFRWWCEAPGASPGGWTRWGYVDIEAVRSSALQVPEPPPRYVSGDPCPRCGCAHLWASGARTVVAVPADEHTASHTVTITGEPTCTGCSRFSDAHAGLVEVAWWIVGVKGTLWKKWPIRGLDAVELMGLTWFADRPVQPREDLRKVTLAPFAYLDIEALRCKAFESLNLRAHWRDTQVYAALRAKYGDRP